MVQNYLSTQQIAALAVVIRTYLEEKETEGWAQKMKGDGSSEY